MLLFMKRLPIGKLLIKQPAQAPSETRQPMLALAEIAFVKTTLSGIMATGASAGQAT
jgi:hypothetical protein